MKKTAFKLSKHWLAVLIFLSAQMTVLTHAQNQQGSNGSWPSFYNPDSLCQQAINEVNNIRKELRDKCPGSRKSCEAAALECDGEDGESGGSSGWSALSSILSGGAMSMLGGGMLSPTAGAPGTQGFQCLTKENRNKIRDDMKEMRKEAVEGEKDAKNYKREVENEAKDLRKEMADLKKDFYEKVANSKKAAVQINEDIAKAREDAKIQAAEVLQKLDENEKKKAALIGEQEIAQAQAQSLYPETVGVCADQMTEKKNKKVEDFFNLKQEAETAISAVSDLREQERIRQKYNRRIAEQETFFKEGLRMAYDGCLKAQTRAYQMGFKQIQNKIASMAKEVQSLEAQNKVMNQQLQDIPKLLAQRIDGLKKNLDADAQLALQQLQAMDGQIKESVADYQKRYMEAQQSYLQAQQKLNAEQMKVQANQAAFQLNTFGDAASVLSAIDDARGDACEACSGKVNLPYCKSRGSSASDDGSI